MTNQSRLKILGIGLVIVGLGAFFLIPYSLTYYAHPIYGHPIVMASLPLGGLFLPIIGLACYARGKGRSVFWGAIGIFPIVGPLSGLAAIAVDDLLSKRSAPKLVRRLATSVVALSGPALILVLLAIAIPVFLRMEAKSLQREARFHLGKIYVAESAFKAKFERYSTFDEIGFTLAPRPSNRYTYRVDNSGEPGTVFPAKDGTFTPDNTVVHAGISVDGQSFTATATANLDDDPTLDQWHVTDGRIRPIHDTNDRKD